MQAIMKYLWVIILVFWNSEAQNQFNILNLVQVNMSDVVYKRLMVTKDNVLTAPPLTVLDVSLLAKYYCYQNIRRNLWSLGIPIIFWTDTYMEKIKNSISNENRLKNFTSYDIPVLPPSGITAFRLNWRREHNIEGDNNTILDQSWHDAEMDYVLPMRYSFLMEFKESNDSKRICAETKQKLLNEPLQGYELSVDFQRAPGGNLSVDDIQIKILDIRSASPYNEFGCDYRPANSCIITIKNAERWSFETSSRLLKTMKIFSTNVQKEVYQAVFNYLCKERTVSDVEYCRVPNYIYANETRPCGNTYHPGWGYNWSCPPPIDHGNDVIATVQPTSLILEKNRFSKWVTKY